MKITTWKDLHAKQVILGKDEQLVNGKVVPEEPGDDFIAIARLDFETGEYRVDVQPLDGISRLIEAGTNGVGAIEAAFKLLDAELSDKMDLLGSMIAYAHADHEGIIPHGDESAAATEPSSHFESVEELVAGLAEALKDLVPEHLLERIGQVPTLFGPMSDDDMAQILKRDLSSPYDELLPSISDSAFLRSVQVTHIDGAPDRRSATDLLVKAITEAQARGVERITAAFVNRVAGATDEDMSREVEDGFLRAVREGGIIDLEHMYPMVETDVREGLNRLFHAELPPEPPARDVDAVLESTSKLTGIPISTLRGAQQEKFDNAEDYPREDVFGQDGASEQSANADLALIGNAGPLRPSEEFRPEGDPSTVEQYRGAMLKALMTDPRESPLRLPVDDSAFIRAVHVTMGEGGVDFPAARSLMKAVFASAHVEGVDAVDGNYVDQIAAAMVPKRLA